MAIDQVVNVVTMGNRFVTAAGTVNMTGFVTAASVRGCASVRIGIGHLKPVLHDTAVIGYVVQVTIVQVVDMVTVLDAGVLALRTVLMIVVFMNV